MSQARKPALVFAAVAALLLAWAHQALTGDAKKTVVVLSSSDVIGYLTPCG
jgi:hypothetical protein